MTMHIVLKMITRNNNCFIRINVYEIMYTHNLTWDSVYTCTEYNGKFNKDDWKRGSRTEYIDERGFQCTRLLWNIVMAYARGYLSLLVLQRHIL